MGAQQSTKRSTMSEEEKELVSSGLPIIVIFGQSGTGKSTFINLIVEEKQPVGKGIDSCTDRVRFVKAKYHGNYVVIVDTPGIDDTRPGIKEADVLEKIALSLKETGLQQKWVTGILYMHRITDPKYTTVAQRVSNVLEKLCGEESLSRITFCTAMWSEPSSVEHTQRHQALCEAPILHSMIIRGVRTAKHSNYWANAQENAEEIVHDLIQGAEAGPLTIQTQTIDLKMTVPETDAGQVLIDKNRKCCIVC